MIIIKLFLLDHEEVLGFPLKGSGNTAVDFYQSYLETTRRLWNPYTSGTTNFTSFLDNGFLIVANLDQLGITEGVLQVRLRFNTVQEASNISLLWVPIATKTLRIDRSGEVTVE